MIQLVLRSARRDDASEVARLSTELGYPIQPEEMAFRLERLINDPAHHIVVACGEDDTIVGWIHVESRFSLEGGAKAEIMGLVVATSAHRQGIGRALVDRAESWAAGQGLAKITVRSNAVREESHPFYKACAFTHQKTQEVYAKALPVKERG